MDTNLKNLVSRRIKRSLNEAQISQTQLSGMINKSRAYVSNITKGRYMPKIGELQKIANFVNKPLGYFFGEDTVGLMHFVEKAKKWDKIAKMVDKDLTNEITEDIIQIPLVNASNVKDVNYPALLKLLRETKTFVPISRLFLRESLKHFKPAENLIGITVVIRDYPSFDIKLGDIMIVEPSRDNNIEDGSGKLFAFIYKKKAGVKRIYQDGNEYYFEPVNRDPEVGRINIKDPDLIILGRVLFALSVKSF